MSVAVETWTSHAASTGGSVADDEPSWGTSAVVDCGRVAAAESVPEDGLDCPDDVTEADTAGSAFVTSAGTGAALTPLRKRIQTMTARMTIPVMTPSIATAGRDRPPASSEDPTPGESTHASGISAEPSVDVITRAFILRRAEHRCSVAVLHDRAGRSL